MICIDLVVFSMRSIVMVFASMFYYFFFITMAFFGMTYRFTFLACIRHVFTLVWLVFIFSSTSFFLTCHCFSSIFIRTSIDWLFSTSMICIDLVVFSMRSIVMVFASMLYHFIFITMAFFCTTYRFTFLACIRHVFTLTLFILGTWISSILFIRTVSIGFSTTMASHVDKFWNKISR